MSKVINFNKYKYERNKVIDEKIANAKLRIFELECLIEAWRLSKHE
tara:strand:- start:11033 stop:11170 length:138 start_codon:yes stop_codon:yes gene_type:complete